MGPPPRNPEQRKITTNGVVISAYTFMPGWKMRTKIPLIILLHTEVHGDFNPNDDFRVTRELVEEHFRPVHNDLVF